MEPSKDSELKGAPSARRRARVLAFRALYAAEIDPDGMTLGQRAQEILDSSSVPSDIRDFAAHLLSLAATYAGAVDEALKAALSREWSMKRLAATDRAVLRLGAVELMFSPELATGIILDEAIEIAKRYGTPQSGRFVNGVLNQVAQTHRTAGAPEQT